uniref:Myozenin 3 n=1 Tax=Pelodiscus sinensis TaxID=13735 RepID=K7FYP6_PELSI
FKPMKSTLPISPYTGSLGYVYTSSLDLGKKVSVPQDLMVEELSLQSNRGSQLFQKRQKRVQKFILEHPMGYGAGAPWAAMGHLHGMVHHKFITNSGSSQIHRASVSSAEGKENYPPEPHMAAAGMSKALNPDVLAPGYSGPLKEVPPEKFNFTVIPKAYCSPWQEFLSSEDYRLDSKSQLPELPSKPSHLELRSFNRTPIPFGGVLLNDMFPVPALEMEALMDTPNSLELVWNRPSFNRAAKGWVAIMPETEEL